MNYLKACSVLPPGCRRLSFLQPSRYWNINACRYSFNKNAATHKAQICRLQPVTNLWLCERECLCLRRSMCFEWVASFDLHLAHWLKPCECRAHGSPPLGSTFLCPVISKHTPLNINKAGRLVKLAHVSAQNSHCCFAQTVKWTRPHLLTSFSQ